MKLYSGGSNNKTVTNTSAKPEVTVPSQPAAANTNNNKVPVVRDNKLNLATEPANEESVKQPGIEENGPANQAIEEENKKNEDPTEKPNSGNLEEQNLATEEENKEEGNEDNEEEPNSGNTFNEVQDTNPAPEESNEPINPATEKSNEPINQAKEPEDNDSTNTATEKEPTPVPQPQDLTEMKNMIEDILNDKNLELISKLFYTEIKIIESIKTKFINSIDEFLAGNLSIFGIIREMGLFKSAKYALNPKNFPVKVFTKSLRLLNSTPESKQKFMIKLNKLESSKGKPFLVLALIQLLKFDYEENTSYAGGAYTKKKVHTTKKKSRSKTKKNKK